VDIGPSHKAASVTKDEWLSQWRIYAKWQNGAHGKVKCEPFLII